MFQVLFPIVVTKRGNGLLLYAQFVNIATQDKTEAEVKENMADLINDYMTDPDTVKPSHRSL